MAHDSNRDFISLRESVEDTTRNNIGINYSIDETRIFSPLIANYPKANMSVKRTLKDPRERYVVSKLDRYELEDRYLRVLDEVNTLKILSNDQEDKLKKLATKLMRATANLRPCSVALEVLEDKNKITALEAENSKLKQRLSVLKNQLLSHTSITSKPSSRIRTPQLRPSSGQMTRSETSTMKQPSYHSMLVSNSSEEKHFFEELEEERNEMRDRIAQLEKDLCHCSANNQREKAAENVEYIKVWRQMQQLNDKVISATDTNDALNAQINELKSSLEEATKHNEEITQALIAERKRIADIDEQLMKAKESEVSLREKDEQIKDLMNELKILQQLNNELIALSKKYGQIEKENAMLKKRVSEQLQDQQAMRSSSTDEQATITALQSANEQLVGKLSSFQDNIDNLSRQLSVAHSQKDSKEVTPAATQTPSEHTISSKELSATYVDSKGQLYTEAELAKQCQQCCELLDNFEPLTEEEEEKVEKEEENTEAVEEENAEAVEEEKVDEVEEEEVEEMEEPEEVEHSESEKCFKCCQHMEKIYLEKRITSSEICRIMYEKAVQTDYVAMSELQMPMSSEPGVTTSTQATVPGQDEKGVGQESPTLSPNEMLELLDKVQINTPLEAVSLSRRNTTSRIPSTEAEVSLSRKGTSSTIGSMKAEGEQSRKSSSGTSTSIKPTAERTSSEAVISHHSEEILSPEPESDETLSTPSDVALQSDVVVSSQSDPEPSLVPTARREASTEIRQSRPRWKTNGITLVPCENIERKPLSKIVEESKPSSDGKADTSRKRSSVKAGSSNAKRHRRTTDAATTKPVKTPTPPSSPRKTSTKTGTKKSTGAEKSKPSSGSPDSPRRPSSSMFKSSVPGGCTCSCTERTGIPCTSQSLPVKNAVNNMTTSIQNMITGSCITCMQHTSDTVGGYRNKPCLDDANAPLQDDKNLQKYVDALDMYRERLAITSSTHSKISGTSITDTMNIERTRGGRSLSQTCRANSICCLTCPNKNCGNGTLLSDTFPLLITDNQGLLELHIAQLQLSSTSKQALFRDGDSSNVSFGVSWEILNQERASTPILMGPKLNYNSSFVYPIPDLSAFFMFVLNEYVIFQVTIVRHGREEHVAARAKLCIKDILDYPQNKLHYIAPMNSVAACSLGMNFGQLSLWVRLSCDVQKVDAFKTEQGLHSELRESKDIARLDMKEIEAKIEATSQETFEPIEQLSGSIVSHKITEPVSYEPLIQSGPLNSLSLTSDLSGPFPLGQLPIPTELPVVSPLLPKDANIRRNSMIKVHRSSSIPSKIHIDDIVTDEEEEDDPKESTTKSKKEGVETAAKSSEPRVSGSSRLDEIQADTPSLIEFNSLLQTPLEKDTILIQIVDLSLFESSSIMTNDEIVMLYVEYSFLGYRGESMETQSVEKPKSSNQKMTYNFRKKFRLDERMHGVQRNTLKAMLDESINSNIRFIVISEPVPEETESKECEEVGYASFNIREFGLGDGQKIVSLPVTTQDQNEEIGVLKIFILGFDVIQQCIEENEEDL